MVSRKGGGFDRNLNMIVSHLYTNRGIAVLTVCLKGQSAVAVSTKCQPAQQVVGMIENQTHVSCLLLRAYEIEASSRALFPAIRRVYIAFSLRTTVRPSQKSGEGLYRLPRIILFFLHSGDTSV